MGANFSLELAQSVVAFVFLCISYLFFFANFSLDLVQSVDAFVNLCISYLKGLLLPDEHGASAFLPKVTDQLKKLDRQKFIDGEEFLGSSLSFSPSERCNWMTKIHEVRRPIGQILWPGTHYSATNKIGFPIITRPFGQRQTMSIFDQLVNGIRALDIRIQQDHRVCSGSMLCDTTIGDVISDIKLFLEKTKFEIIILELQTERGFCDPENFEGYLVENFGDRLIHQNDQVFFKSISEVLPGRIICIWKPILNAFMPREGGPIWSGKYLQCDEFDTQMPLTRFDGNIHNLKGRSTALKINNYFYKVENTLNPQTSTTLESLLVWPKCANVVSKRINGFSRLFLAKCYKDGTLSRLQVYSVDFVNDDFISACIGLNQESTTTQESSRLVEIRHNDNNNVSSNINNNSSSSNYVNVDATTITWETSEYRWIQPKNLKISRVDDKRRKWVSKPYEAAHMLQVNSLAVMGNYEIDNDLLQQGVSYEVLFDVVMLDSAFGWESPIHVRLTLPDGSIQANQLILDTTPTKELYISVGNFVTPMKGEIKFSLEQLDNTLKGGIFINGVLIQQSFVDLVIPKDFSIKLHDVGECLRWSTSHFDRFAKRQIEWLELISVRDLKVGGIFETEKLVFGCTYKVGFVISLGSTATGWENPTKMTLLFPNGSVQQRRGSFNDMPRDKDILIYVGEFKMSPGMVGKLVFSMENNNVVEKTGLLIYKAFIQQQH